MRHYHLTTLLALCCTVAVAQPRYDTKNLAKEKLGRGVVALKTTEGKVAVTWRILSDDAKGEAFDIFRNGRKLNEKPLTGGGAYFIDDNPADGEATYEVRGGGKNGSYTLKADAPAGYIPIDLDVPQGGETPDGRKYSYNAGDASVGDADGDGEYEIFLKWEPTNSRDNSHSGFTGNTLIDCYKLTGEKLWRIDLGRNIRSGAHYTPFIVYDLDGDGKAELMVKTADGTTDSKGNVIGDANADWRTGVKEAAANRSRYAAEDKANARQREKMRREWEKARREGRQPSADFRRKMRRTGFRNTPGGRILAGPEYLTVFNGLTGEAMATVDYVPGRGPEGSWGDSHGNRSERYLAAVGYFGREKASAVFCRGYYTRTVLAAWNWDGKNLTNHWTFDTDNPEWKDYAGQGNHNLRVADVDGDGYDEITYGSMAVDHDGRGLYNTRMGHGDAIHLTAFDPSTEELMVWDCHENRRDGSELRNARTGEVIFQIKSSEDVGRCMAADIDPTNYGVEMWSSDSKGIRNIKGEIVTPKSAGKTESDDRHAAQGNDNTALFIRGMRLPTNSAVWWDGDLLREMLDHETVSKYDWENGTTKKMAHFDGCRFNNGTKSNPCLSADILGDWREEVIVRTEDNRQLRIYVTAISTSHRINCLMEDIPYRLSVATENVGYNQPPETGFYLGPDKAAKDFLK